MAYLIAGHGEEIPYNTENTEEAQKKRNQKQKKTFTVPPRCTIVVHKHPYEVISNTEYFQMTDKLLSLPKEVIANPAQHKYEIIHTLGSVVFYEAGMECPYFKYQTLSCFPSELPFTHCTGRIGSGVNNIMTMKDEFAHTNRERQSQYKNTDINYDNIDLRADTLTTFKFDEIVELLSSMYRFSVYPEQQDISTFIRNALFTWKLSSLPKGVRYADMGEEDNINGIELEIIKNILRVLVRKDFINPTQEFLCKKFPGVYYNFVCRHTEQTQNINQLINNLNKSQTKHTRLLFSKPKLLRAPAFKINTKTNTPVPSWIIQSNEENKLNEDPSITNRLQNINNNIKRKNTTVNLLKTRIVEAELQRKKNIKNFYTNPKYLSTRIETIKKRIKEIDNEYVLESKREENLAEMFPNIAETRSDFNLRTRVYQNKLKNKLKNLEFFTNFESPSNSEYIQLQNGTKRWVKRGGTRKRK
jgi:hypothetical protein